jgi:hypothetical protein
MLAQADLQNALAQALGEFGPAWRVVSECSPVNPLDPSHWAVGSQSFHVNIRHRVTGRLKVLGRRVADEPSASLHRAVAHSLVDSYVHGNADPIRRYLEDIGVAANAESDGGHFFRRPAAVAAAPVSTTRAVAEPLEAQAPGARTPVARAPVPAAEPPRGLPIAELPRHLRAAEPRRRVSTVEPSRPVSVTESPRPAPVTEPPRQVLPVAALGSGVMRAPGTGGSRVLRRFKREFAIWQWRRAAGSSAQKSASGRDD